MPNLLLSMLKMLQVVPMLAMRVRGGALKWSEVDRSGSV